MAYEPEAWGKVPNFCTDRNDLKEVWNAVDKADREKREQGSSGEREWRQVWGVYYRTLQEIVNVRHPDYIVIQQHCMRAEPRSHVIAALHALNAWKAEGTPETPVRGT